MRLAPAPAARRPGLSLLEVILSLAILVMSMSALGILINTGTDDEMHARLNNVGTRLAQSKLAEVEAGIQALEEVATPTEFTDQPGWTWTMKAEDQGKNLWLVTVAVSYTQRGKPFQLSLGQMMLDPSVRGSAAKLTRPTAATTDGGSP